MKKILYWLFISGLLFLNINVFASSISNIEMDIEIAKNGNALVKEKWITNVNEGTEVFKQYENLGESDITDLEVFMNGTKFTTLDSWDTSKSFDDKKYKAGINKIEKGKELCFGISEYGKNTYTFSYKISNFVVANKDKDMIYWELIPQKLTLKPNHFYIKIHSDFQYKMTDEVWGYGYEGGYAYVNDGFIELTSDKNLNVDEYVVVLAEFPKGTFDTIVNLDNDSKYYEELAKSGSFEEKISIGEIIAISTGSIIFITLMITAIVTSHNTNICGEKKLIFKKGDRKLSKDVLPFRDIPCHKDIYYAYWLAGNYNLYKSRNDFLGAILLKWLKDDIVKTEKVERKGLKKETNAIKFNSIDNYSCPEIEKDLYNFMIEASKDGILENSEFTSWCKQNYEEIISWFNKVFDYQTEELVKQGLINEKDNKYYIDSKIKEEASRMKGLKIFLKEFTLINEKETIEVKSWKDYLIFAQILGIAKTVAKQFKNLYPDIIPVDTLDDFIFIYALSYNGVNAASIAKDRADNYDAGGGGTSFGGGGMGSFGGGGGGFR